MKLRIQDDAVRFRITLKELEVLRSEGAVRRETRALGPNGPDGTFRYALVRDPEAKVSRLELDAASITMRLAPADFETLASENEEGVYIRREWSTRDGSRQRFMAFVEKDRPGSTCNKPEEWIYEERRGERPETRPIPSAK
jgi:hypothetical protein